MPALSFLCSSASALAHGKLLPYFFTMQLVSSGLQAVKSCLDAGLVPVLHGDVVLDDQQGSTILSGDRVVSYLAEVRPNQQVSLHHRGG
jgi:isopentenyl phosphate kinase